MVVLIDIGNSNIVLSRYENNEIGRPFRYNTDKTKSVDEYYVLLKEVISDANAIVISSVVPELNIIIKNLAITYLNLEPIFMGPGVKTGVRIVTDNPKEVGSDLVSSAAATIAHYGDNALVIDMGTATTFTLIENKIIKGVSITAGLVTQKNALIGNASQLSQFEFRTPKKVIATNTIDCLNSGLLYGNAYMIKGMINAIRQESKQELKVVITGGASRFIQELLREETFVFDHLLLLKGLLVIYNKNK